jgi:hypothetical protein
MADGSPEPCWCTRLPPAVPVPEGAAGCWCPACLEQHIATARQEQQGEVPPERLN